MKVLFFILLNFLTTQLCLAKLYPGTIYLRDGHVIQTNIEPPSRPSDIYVNYSVKKGKLEGLKSYEVESISVQLNKNQIVVYSYLNVENEKKQKYLWVVLTYQTNKMQVYTSANEYFISNNNYLSLDTSDLNGNEGFTYYLKKTNTQNLFKVFEYNQGLVENNSFYDNLAFYCRDEPRLVKSIKNKEFFWKDIYKLCEIYNTLSEYRELNSLK